MVSIIAIYRKCSICGKKVEQYKKCECEITTRRDSYKEYKKHRQDKDRQRLYSSKTWIRLRDVMYRKFMALCIVCLLKDNKIVNATTVHHVIPTEDDDSRWLDESNLCCVCSRCHQLIHNQYESKNKKEIQNILFGLIKKFEKEYG
ncbi:5-methylcytosine-specific restriction endonuclease McrA [Clostridium beijerinckii]|nr:5-methylcytosine-specific restriction endonuclease McrA [Clostridium beijerinckii]